MSRVLLTGGGGYLGGHIALELLENDYSVVVIDKILGNPNNTITPQNDDMTKPPNLRRVEKISGKEVTFESVDLSDLNSIRTFFRRYGQFDGIIHTAGLKGGSLSTDQPIRFYHGNVGISLNLLQAIDEIDDWKHKNFVFTSSSSLYGDGEDAGRLEENSPTVGNRKTPYGRGKAIVETILQDLCEANRGWNALALRPFNIIGAHSSGEIGENPTGPPCNLIPYVAEVASGIRPEITIFGTDYTTPDGTGVQDYVHVMDVASAHVLALQHLLQTPTEKGFEAYNICSGVATSVLQIIQAFEQVSGVKIPVVYGQRRAGDVTEHVGVNSKACRVLGWTPAYSTLHQMISDTWNWRVSNPLGYDS